MPGTVIGPGSEQNRQDPYVHGVPGEDGKVKNIVTSGYFYEENRDGCCARLGECGQERPL